MSHLRFAGWKGSIVQFRKDLKFVEFKKGVPVVTCWYWTRRLDVSQSYVFCLALSSQLAARGVKDIPHNMTNQFYCGFRILLGEYVKQKERHTEFETNCDIFAEDQGAESSHREGGALDAAPTWEIGSRTVGRGKQ